MFKNFSLFSANISLATFQSSSLPNTTKSPSSSWYLILVIGEMLLLCVFEILELIAIIKSSKFQTFSTKSVKISLLEVLLELLLYDILKSMEDSGIEFLKFSEMDLISLSKLDEVVLRLDRTSETLFIWELEKEAILSCVWRLLWWFGVFIVVVGDIIEDDLVVDEVVDVEEWCLALNCSFFRSWINCCKHDDQLSLVSSFLNFRRKLPCSFMDSHVIFNDRLFCGMIWFRFIIIIRPLKSSLGSLADSLNNEDDDELLELLSLLLVLECIIAAAEDEDKWILLLLLLLLCLLW